MFRSKISPPAGVIAVALAAAAALAGCSDLYMDHRDSIALSAGDAVAANQMAQMYDPWPARSGNVNYAANGQKMQSAIERYRTNMVTPPVPPMALVSGNPSQSTAQTNGSQNGGSSNTVPSIAGGASPATSNTASQ
jgi:hypothetical protein